MWEGSFQQPWRAYNIGCVCVFAQINMSAAAPEKPRILALFDVDGTLTIPRGEVSPEMLDFMKELSKKVTVGIVGGA